MLVALVALATGSSLVPAFADVYSTPGGEAAVGTNGEHVYADHLAVSNGGHAATYQGIALNTTGTATGTYAAASGTGCAFAPYSLVAVSGTGCADASVVSASGAGPAGHNNPSGAPGLVGASGAGCAKGAYVGVSGTGCAEGGYAGVSAAGQANGGVVGVTGWGNAGGGTASVDADRTVGTVNGTAWKALADNHVYYNKGFNPVPSAYQLWVQATYPQPDPQSEAAKLQAAAEMRPKIAETVANREVPHLTPTASASYYEDSFQIADAAPRGSLDQWPYEACLPAAAKNTYGHRGMPSYEQLRNESGNGESNGTDIDTMASVIRKHYVGPMVPAAHTVSDHLDLISKVMASVTKWRQGAIVSVDTASLWWWTQYEGRPTPGMHALTVSQYAWQKGTAYAGLWGWDSGMAHFGWGDYLIWAHDLFIAMSTGTMEGGGNKIIY